MSKIALTPNASGSGTFTIASPNSDTDRTLDLPDGAGTLDRLERAGNVLQVVQVTPTSTPFDFNGTSYASFLSASITPTSTSSKILIQTQIAHKGGTVDSSGYFAIYADGTIINGSVAEHYYGSNGYYMPSNHCILHSPNTTSAVSYEIRVKVSNGSATWRIFGESSGNQRGTFFTLTEIAG